MQKWASHCARKIRGSLGETVQVKLLATGKRSCYFKHEDINIANLHVDPSHIVEVSADIRDACVRRYKRLPDYAFYAKLEDKSYFAIVLKRNEKSFYQKLNDARIELIKSVAPSAKISLLPPGIHLQAKIPAMTLWKISKELFTTIEGKGKQRRGSSRVDKRRTK